MGGIAPIEGDSVVIALGHVVTVDGTYTAGDDTVTAFTVNGTLKASRTVNSSLTIKGQLLTAGATTATIDYGRRSTSDPIPAGVTATLILNKSSAMVNFKYGLFVGDTANFYACGATKTINSRLSADLSASGTSVTVTDITGWAVGDNIIFAPSSGTSNQYDEKTILTITPGAGTTGTITFGAVTYLHGSNCPIGNRTSNVTIKNFDTSTVSFFCSRHTSTASNNRREIDYVSFERIGSNAAITTTQVTVSSSSVATITTPFLTFSNSFYYNCGVSSAGLYVSNVNTGGFYIDNLGFFDTVGSAPQFYLASGTFVGLKNSVFYHALGSHVFSANSQGGQGCLLTDNTHCSSQSSYLFSDSNGDGFVLLRCGFHTALASNAYILLNSGSGTFTNCNFGYTGTITGSTPTLWGTPSATYIVTPSVSASKGDWTMTDCYFRTPSTSFVQASFVALMNPQWILRVGNKNLDPLVQEIYTPPGNIQRDNTSKISGVQSVKMSPLSSTNALTFVLYIPAPTGVKVGVSGYLWRDTANVSTVTLSGLGITPSVYTASGTLSANEQFFVSGTQTSGTNGFLTLTFSTIGTSGNMWVDSVSAPQASAIDFGEFGYWVNALPAQVVSSNTVTGVDVWNTLQTNVSVSGSMGLEVRNIRPSLM